MRESQEKFKQILKDWLPTALALCVTVAVLFYYIFARDEVKLTNYLSLLACAAASCALPIANKRLKLGFPLWLVAVMLCHFVLSIDFGTVLDVYDKIFWWDLLSHGLFGFWAAAVCFYLYARFSEKVGVFGYIIIFLSVMGLAAVWEVYEYLAGALLNEDMQRVQESINLGKSPLFDTMTDIMIAAAGVALFYIGIVAAYFIKKALNRRKDK